MTLYAVQKNLREAQRNCVEAKRRYETLSDISQEAFVAWQDAIASVEDAAQLFADAFDEENESQGNYASPALDKKETYD